MPTRFVLYSLARCGSTTFNDLLNCHEDIRSISEPFEPQRYGGQYYQTVTDAASLDKTLDIIWQSYDGIKHVWHPNGAPFVGRPDLNKRLISSPVVSVLFLTRRNILQRLLSNQIQRQSRPGVLDPLKRWVLETFSGPRYVPMLQFVRGLKKRRLRTFAFAPIDRSVIATRLAEEKGVIDEYRSLLLKSGTRFVDVYYEDLFGSTLTMAEKIEKLNNVLAFLGRRPISNTEQSNVENLFGPAQKIATSDVYRSIPGIEKIEAEFGSDETGWIFK